MKTFYDKQKEMEEILIRDGISHDFSNELRLKSVVIGMVILIIANFTMDNFKIFSIFSLCYIAICIVDLFGRVVHWACMKKYDSDLIFELEMKAIAMTDEFYTKSISINTLVYILFNYAVFKALMLLF